jgi:alkylation response protein AidB-like acyl-CoA dehydrogenase
MTFDLTPEQSAHVESARAVARTVAPFAAALDSGEPWPEAVLTVLRDAGVASLGPVERVLVLEELAVTSASAAALVACEQEAPGDGLSGLRGVTPVAAATASQQMGMAAVSVGIGRAALDAALAATRARGDRPGGDPGDPPHWALADAATEIDAARLLVLAAAQGHGVGAAGALVFAGGAAARAVDAALRIIGAEAYTPGSVTERCSRDVRAAQLVLGTEDVARRTAADALLD